MSLQRKWVLTIVSLVAAGALISAPINLIIALQSARMGAFEWLRSAYSNSAQHQLRRSWEDLAAHARLLSTDARVLPYLEGPDLAGIEANFPPLSPFHSDHDFWLVARGSEVRSGLSACASEPGLGAWLAGRQRAVVWCGGSPAFVATHQPPSPTSARVFVGHAIDAHCAQLLRTITNAEVSFVGEAGSIATSLKSRSGAPLPFAFPDELDRRALAAQGSWFGTGRLSVPDYGGYDVVTRPTAVGDSSVVSYLFVGALEEAPPGAPVYLALTVPRFFMDQGAWFTTATVMGVSMVLMFVLSFLAWKVMGRISRFLDALQRAHLGPRRRFPTSGVKELDALGKSVSEIVDKLGEQRARALQSEKLAAIGQLAGGVAHEINNPLSIILGFAQGLAARVPEGHPLRMPVESIEREALRCRALVQELLVFSRTAKKDAVPVDINGAVAASVLLLQARARTQDVTVRTELAPGLPAVLGNRIQVQQIVVNLGTNALDATQAGGFVSVRTRAHQGGVVLEVADTGAGIPDDVLSHVFEPFFTTKEPGKGTGLGLSLVWEIVNQWGGHIEVQSEVGQGTHIEVFLPGGNGAATPAEEERTT